MFESQSTQCSCCCGVSCGIAQHVYVKKSKKKTKTHKHSRDSQKINTFPCGMAHWLIGAVRNRSNTKQPLCQWYTGKKQPDACVNPTAGDSSGTGSHQKRSPDRFQIPGPEVGFGWCKERFMVFSFSECQWKISLTVDLLLVEEETGQF